MLLQRPLVVTVSLSLVLGGCATSSQDIAAAYASPLLYQSYDCEQIAAEVQRIQGRVKTLAGRLDEAASNDKALVGVGIILFWPALFALGGTKTQEAEYARLKGEYDAAQQVAIQKKCATMTASTTPAGVPAGVPTTLIAAPAPPAPAQLAAGAFAPGDRLTYRSFETISGAPLGEQTLVLTASGAGRCEYNHGEWVTDQNGNWLSGRVLSVRFTGTFRPTYEGTGSWRGRVTSNADPDDFADLEVRNAGPSTFSAEGVMLTAARLDVSGYPSSRSNLVRGIGGAPGQLIRGHVLVDPSSGVILEIVLPGRHPTLATKWQLVRRVRPG